MAKIALKLVHFKEHKKYFALLKHSNLAQFSPQCKHSLSKQNKKQKYLHLSKVSLEKWKIPLWEKCLSSKSREMKCGDAKTYTDGLIQLPLCGLQVITNLGEVISQPDIFKLGVFPELKRTARIRHPCRKTTVLSSHRCLINTFAVGGKQP